MYERSAIVLEKYFNDIFGFNEKINLKTIYENYNELINEIQTYQMILEDEDKVINEFDEVANEIRNIQQEQKKIYRINTKLEDDRDQFFDNLDENPAILDKNIKKIEDNLDKNNERLKELRESFVSALSKFNEKQEERNKYSRNRRAEEAKHIQLVEKADKEENQIDIALVKEIKEFINSEDEDYRNEIVDIMINNGKDERVPFNKDVIENAVNVRNEIAKKEAECYLVIFDRMKKLLLEINNDEIKIDKYRKTLRDVEVKLAFLNAQKNYIVSFLDNERMTAINGLKIHKKKMQEACDDFQSDMEQFNNLYELILREITGKATKKSYKELYNKEYLKNIEEKERNFEKEVNNIKINTGTIINSNYWRIEEIKNIYEVFQNEVSEKFQKDLSEFRLEEKNDIYENMSRLEYEEEADVEVDDKEEEDDIFKTKVSDDDVEYIEEYEYDDEEDEDEYYDEDYEDEDYDEDEEDEEDDTDDEDEEYEEDEYDDDSDEEDEDDDSDDEDYEDEDYDEDEEDEEDDEFSVEKLVKKHQKSNKNEEIKDKKQKKKGLFNKFF